MNVQRLAIIGVYGNYDVRNDETRAGAMALLDKYERQHPTTSTKLSFVKLGNTPGSKQWNPAEDEVEFEVGYDIGNIGGTLGVYVLAHGSMAGLDGVVDEAKFFVMLEHLDLLKVKKLCLIACNAAHELFHQGQVVGNPSTLRKLCEYIGAPGRDCKPAMAGWSSFVTVVNDEMFKKTRKGKEPMHLGDYKSATSRNWKLVPPTTENIGRKALSSPSDRSAHILASSAHSGNKSQKVFYTYRDGATRIEPREWTDKPT